MKRPNEMAKLHRISTMCDSTPYNKHDPSILFFFKRNHINHASEKKEDI